MPGGRWAIVEPACFGLPFARALVILDFAFPTADYVTDISGVAVTNMDCARWQRAPQSADLGIFVKLLARMLTLPLDSESIRHILAHCPRCREKHAHSKATGNVSDHGFLPVWFSPVSSRQTGAPTMADRRRCSTASPSQTNAAARSRPVQKSCCGWTGQRDW